MDHYRTSIRHAVLMTVVSWSLWIPFLTLVPWLLDGHRDAAWLQVTALVAGGFLLMFSLGAPATCLLFIVLGWYRETWLDR